MKYLVAITALAPFVPRLLALTVNTPASVVACQPQLLTWNGGVPPYYPSIIPGGQPSAAPLKVFPTQSGESVTWVVDLPGRTSITILVKDSTGNTAFTDQVNIQSGPDSSCLSGGAVELAGGAAATATNPIMALSTGSSGPAASGASGPSGAAPSPSGASPPNIGGATSNNNGGTTSRPPVVPNAAAGTTNGGAATSSPTSFSGAQGRLNVVDGSVLVGLGLLGAIFL